MCKDLLAARMQEHHRHFDITVKATESVGFITAHTIGIRAWHSLCEEITLYCNSLLFD